ncbi:MAG: BrnA antitoxin family protein [Candidatus Riflebacteria bacterium]|nr:BrnA antitoxin family protein [Candidatus Riflebacteria bacterium]
MKKKVYSDLNRVRKMKDRDIILDDDAPELTKESFKNAVFFPHGVKNTEEIRAAFEAKYGIDLSFFDRAKIEEPPPAKTISLRIPLELLEWWKQQGKGYQTRMIALMRAYMQDQLKKAKAT